MVGVIGRKQGFSKQNLASEMCFWLLVMSSCEGVTVKATRVANQKTADGLFQLVSTEVQLPLRDAWGDNLVN